MAELAIPSSAFPPGYQFDLKTQTSDVAFSGTSAATAGTLITGNAVTYDGTTTILIEAYGSVNVGANFAAVNVWEDSTDLAAGWQGTAGATTTCYALYIRTPSAGSHTYTMKGWNTAAATATLKAGTSWNTAFLRITKV